MNTDTLFELGVNLSKGIRDEDADIARVLSHTNDPETSDKAAEEMVESGKLARQEMMVYIAIKDCLASMTFSTFTARNVALWSGINYYTIQRRLSGLRNKGKIGRVRKDGGICCGPKPIIKYLVVRDSCCVWRLVDGNYLLHSGQR